MAYFIDHNNSYVPTGQMSFYCDDTSDIADLPTSSQEGVPQGDSVTHKKVAPGSTCTCIATSKIYVLNSRDEWLGI